LLFAEVIIHIVIDKRKLYLYAFL